MTKSNPVVEALEHYAACSDGCTCGDGWGHDTAEAALPLAREMAKKLERYERTSESGESLGGEMEYRDALEWLASDFFGPTDIAALRARIDTPAIIKKMIEERK